jgi:hypothetical protein
MSLDNETKKTLQKIPLLSVEAGPRDSKWVSKIIIIINK